MSLRLGKCAWISYFPSVVNSLPILRGHLLPDRPHQIACLDSRCVRWPMYLIELVAEITRERLDLMLLLEIVGDRLRVDRTLLALKRFHQCGRERELQLDRRVNSLGRLRRLCLHGGFLSFH